MATPKRGIAYEFSLTLVDAASPANFRADPTIATGDFKVSTDNGAFADLAALPVVLPAGSVQVRVQLSAAEMDGDKVSVWAKDAAGAEWEEAFVFLDVPTATVEDTPGLVWSEVLEGTVTAEEAMRVLLGTLTGRTTVERNTPSGGLTTVVYKSIDGLTSRYVVVHDNIGVRFTQILDGG